MQKILVIAILVVMATAMVAATCMCPRISAPVCGTDNNTYVNECLAQCAGFNASYVGECTENGSG